MTSAPAPVDLGELRIAQRQRDLAHPVGPEVERDHGVARADAGLLADDRGRDELVGLVALVACCRLLGRVDVVVGLARAPAGRRPSARGPSACRGPWRSSGRSRTRRARPTTRRRRGTSRRPWASVAAVGEGVHDRAVAGQLDQRLQVAVTDECTPPSDTSPIRCTR